MRLPCLNKDYDNDDDENSKCQVFVAVWVIVWVCSVVLRRTVVGIDWRFDNLSGSHHQVVETSVNTNNIPSQDYITNPDDHSNHNIDSPGFKPFTVICQVFKTMWRTYNNNELFTYMNYIKGAFLWETS